MRIGIDARFWHETGVGRYIRNLVFELEKLDTPHEFVLFVRQQDASGIRSSLKNPKFNVVGTKIHWHSLQEQLEFPDVINKEKVDLMHFTYFSVPIRYHRPYVVTIHDLIIHHFATGEATTLPLPLYKLKVLGYRFIISQAAKHACKVIAVSDATKKEILDHLHIQKIAVTTIYEGVDGALERSGKASSNSLGKYFLHVGNVYPHKNAKRLIDAFVRLDLPETSLVFVGKKDYFMKDLETYAKSKFKSETIKFLGFVDDRALSDLYHNALATVVPSLMEGFGLPVLEAMANNSLVLASDIPSLKEVAGDAAVYFNPFEVADISAKIRHIAEANVHAFDDYKKKGLAKTAQYSWADMAKKTIDIYESCISV